MVPVSGATESAPQLGIADAIVDLTSTGPRDRLGDLKSAVPGMDGPTISEILNGGTMVAVHAVVPTARCTAPSPTSRDSAVA